MFAQLPLLLRSQGDTAEVGVPPELSGEPIVLAPLNPRFIQAEPAQSDGARPATLSPLAEVRERVRSEWIRQQADRALRSYIDALKSDA